MNARRFIVPALVLGIAGYFIVFGGEYSLVDYIRLEKQRRAEALELELMRDSVRMLQARVDSLENDPAALERIARERFGMIRPGERLYRFADKDSAASADTAETPRTP